MIAQRPERARGRSNDEIAELALEGAAVELFGEGLHERAFGLVLPIGIFHGAATITDGCKTTARLVRPQFPRGRIGMLAHFARFELRRSSIASVFEEQRLSSVANRDVNAVPQSVLVSGLHPSENEGVRRGFLFRTRGEGTDRGVAFQGSPETHCR